MRKNHLVLLTAAMSVSVFAIAEPAQPQSLTLSNGLTTASGHYVLGTLERVGDSSKNTYLLDTKTGAIWMTGCIAWDSSEKCTQSGFRTVKFSDGSGGKVFNTAKEASDAAALAAPLRR
jgi:hypothetical protein